MPDWPSSLPSPGMPLADARQPAVLRSSMDAGPPKQRRRFTAAIRHVDTVLLLTGSDRRTLDDFFIDDLAEGALAFDWTDPASDATDPTVSMRFRAPIEWDLAAGDDDPDARLWRGRLQLEILP